MPSKPVIRKEDWERRLHEVQITKNDLNRLIMDYLVIEGYKSAAEEFSQEANIMPPVDFESIESRMDIREALQRGDVEEAITRVNELNPEILDTNPTLYFHLQQQKLIEYIRQGRIAEAIEFAQDELGPRGEESPEFLGELERTMALLAFEAVGGAPESILELLSPAQRMKTAGEVNAAILDSLGQGKEVKLVGLVKLLGWGGVWAISRLAFTMLDDPRAPKHRRRLYIANPDPDDVLDVRDDGSLHRPSYPYHTWSSPIHPPRFIPPLATTNLSPSDSPATEDPSLSPDPPLRPSKFARSLAQHAKGPRPADPHARRPRVSPTVSALDTSHSASTPGADKSDVNKLLIVVTADSERYVTVDITGAKHAAFIRECIFSKLKICQDEEQAQYSIYKTEIGDFAIGDALTDDQLYALCRDRGDNKGSLKFLISHKNAIVHEEPHRPYTPVINPIPPPILPNFPPSPLRVTPRSRSRHGSASSASEPMTAEATGYEADLDNAEKDKSAIRHQQQPPITNPAPGNIRKVSGPPLRPSSPFKTSSSPPISIERPQPDVLVTDAHSKNNCPNLPSLSPVRPNFPILEEGTLLPPTSVPLPVRSGLDNGELISKTPEHHIDAKAWKTRPQQPQPQPQHPKLRSESPREDLAKEHRTRVDETKQELDDWTLVSSLAEIESSMAAQEPRTSPTTGRHPRQHDSPLRYVPPGPYPGKSKPPRPPPRHAVPPNYLVTWKGEEGGYRKNGPSSPSTPRLNKGAKSMDNLRLGFSSYTSLGPSPAGYRRNNPLPVSRPSGQGVQRENNYYNGVVASGLPKSYEPSRPVRPLPLQGSTHSSSLDLSQQNHRSPYAYNSSLSPNNDTLARPQSANGENTASPFSSLRHPNDLLDNTRPPRSISPHHSHRTPIGQLSRHHHNDRPADSHNGTEAPRTTPPRSPASPRSPQYAPQPNGVGSILSSSKHGVLDEDELCARSANGQEATLKQEDLVKMSELISNNSESTIIAARLSEVDKATPPSPGSSTSATTLAGTPLTFDGYDDDSDSELGTMIWKKRPEDVKPPMRGPPLTVQTADRPEETTMREATLRPNATMVSNDKTLRGSTFTDMSDSTWAPRPLAEDVYDRLEEFFPEHDLDKPVIEASSGSTSPTAAEPTSSLAQSTHIPASPEKKGIIRARKSIRYVAEDFKKRIDRKASAYANIKRNTKLWGSKVEEVTTGQARSASSISESSPSSAPTFKWVRGELIGKGTFGRVYLAMNANTGEMMAVKQVERPQTASDRNDSRQTSMVQALKLESETLKDLDHPHIVQYLGYEETPTNLSIFLEYVPGGSIGSCLLKHGRFDENVTKSFTYQILDGLHYLHSKGILHRDLKADNILVEMSGVCKISDFGISKRTDDVGGGAFTAMQGTVFWMAPEVINTQKKGYNFKIDIWSVGCVVLEMWAGKRPWTGEESVAVMFKLYQSKLPPPVPDDVKLSEQGDDFRSRCFAINPEERATTSELMAHPYLRLPSDWHFVKFT